MGTPDDVQRPDAAAAVSDATRRFWELYRDLLDAYAVDTGQPIPKLPGWDDLSTASRYVVHSVMLQTIVSQSTTIIFGMLPEVDLSDLG